MILGGKLKPGDRLPPEHTLVERFQVSKVTLREALQTLETYGHVTRKPGRGGGTIVLDIAPTRGIGLLANYLNLSNLGIEALMEARMLVEPAIAALAASRVTPGAAGAIRTLLAEHEADFRLHGGSKRGWEFYIMLAGMTGNPALKVVEELLIRLFMDAEFALSIGDIGMSGEELAYNAAVLPANTRVAEAVIAGDPQAARREMTEALKGFTERITARARAAAPPSP